MARQSPEQKHVVERVMHEFKEGGLETSHGRKVKNPKQAIAIALNEAGASKYESPQKNREHLKRTRRRERAEEGAETRADLYAEAKQRDISGRSKMNKDELRKALRTH